MSQLVQADPFLALLRDNRFLIDLIAEISAAPVAEVARRFQAEHRKLGTNVSAAMRERGIPAHVWTESLQKFYEETDAFLYETTVWNRTPLKRKIRRWIGDYLAGLSPQPSRLLTYGDGLGFDACYLALCGHEVSYFDVSRSCVRFARRVFDMSHGNVTVCETPGQIEGTRFDTILCLDVLEHVPDPGRLVGWLASMLLEGGRLIISAPFHYIDPAVPTHLRSNRRFSGDLRSLYQPHGLYPVDGDLFLLPVVFQKFADPHDAPRSTKWHLRLGSLLMGIGRYWPAPYILVANRLFDYKSLAALAEADSVQTDSTE